MGTVTIKVMYYITCMYVMCIMYMYMNVNSLHALLQRNVLYRFRL